MASRPQPTSRAQLTRLFSAPLLLSGMTKGIFIITQGRTKSKAGYRSDIICTEFARQTDILSKIPSKAEEFGLCSEIPQISVSMMWESQHCKEQQISCLEDFWFVYLSLTFPFFSYSQKILQAHGILCLLSLSCYSGSWFSQDGKWSPNCNFRHYPLSVLAYKRDVIQFRVETWMQPPPDVCGFHEFCLWILH